MNGGILKTVKWWGGKESQWQNLGNFVYLDSPGFKTELKEFKILNQRWPDF